MKMQTIEQKKQIDRDKSLRYRNKNLDACRERAKKWRIANKERDLEYKKEYRKKHILEVQEYNKHYYHKNKEFHQKRLRQWRSLNSLRIRVYNRDKDRIRRESNDGTVNKESIFMMLSKQEYLCNICKKDITNNFEIDHIFPLSKGGLTTISNIQMLCKSCNCSKGNKLL